MRRVLPLLGGGGWQRRYYYSATGSIGQRGGVVGSFSSHVSVHSAVVTPAAVVVSVSPSSLVPQAARRCFSARNNYAQPTLPRCLPVKAIEVMSLGDNNDNSNLTFGRLTKIFHSANSMVEAGDVVAEITVITTFTCNSQQGDDVDGEIVVVPVATPQAGKITQFMYQANDAISVGDVLFHIDTDQQPAPVVTSKSSSAREQQPQQQQQSPSAAAVLVQEFMTHWKENGGSEAKMREWMSCQTPQQLLDVAKMLREMPNLPFAMRSKGLDVLQHVLQTVQEQATSTTSTISAGMVHMELALFHVKLSYWDAATLHFHQALALLEQGQRTDVKNQERMALCHAHLATMARRRQDMDGCIQAFQEALRIQQAILQEVTKTTDDAAKNNNINHGQDDDDVEKASAAVAATYNNLGAIHYETGNYHPAVQYYNLAIEQRNKYRKKNKEHDDTNNENDASQRRRRKGCAELAGSYSNLAMALKQTGDLNGALLACQTSLQLHQQQRQQQDENDNVNHEYYDSDMAASHEAMGIILAEMGQFEGALEQYRAACQIHEGILNNKINTSAEPSSLSLSLSLTVAAMYNKIGAVYYQMKDYNQALLEHDKAMEVLNQADAVVATSANDVPPNLIRDLANTYNHIGLVLLQRRGGNKIEKQGTSNTDDSNKDNVDLHKALESHQTARKMLEEILGKDNPHLAMTVGSIGNVLQEQGKLDEALIAFREAHEFLFSQNEQKQQKSIAHPKKPSPDIAASHNNIGLVLARLGNFDEALVEYRAAKQVFSDSLGSTHPHTASCHFNIGLTLCSQQERSIGTSSTATMSAAAREEFEMARAIWRSELGPDHPQTLMAAEYVEKLTDSTR